jgi:site-specific DNA recombinase
MAELEATFILERTMGGKLEKLVQDEENGCPPPPPGKYPPYGLRYTPPSKKGLPGTWEREPEQAQRVLWMFVQAAKEVPCDAIATALNQRRIPGPRGGYWSDVAVRRIIRSTTYRGDMVRQMGEQSFTFKVEPIVPPELWKAANDTVDKNKMRSRRNSKHEYLLASSRALPLLRCRVCHGEGHEHHMGGRTRTDRATRGKRGEYYECSHRVAGKSVRHRVPAQRLEDAVWDALCAMLRDPDRVLSRIERLADQANAEAREVSARLAALDEVENENRLAQSQLIELAMRRRLAPDLIERQEEKLAAEAERITRERAVLIAQLEQVQSGQAPIRQVRDACALLADGALEAGFSDRKWLIGLLVDTVYADKEGWQMKGYLPGMEAAGTFGRASIEERLS